MAGKSKIMSTVTVPGLALWLILGSGLPMPLFLPAVAAPASSMRRRFESGPALPLDLLPPLPWPPMLAGVSGCGCTGWCGAKFFCFFCVFFLK